MFNALCQTAKCIGNAVALLRKFHCPFRIVVGKEDDVVLKPKHGV